jgi:hypothetical protein
MGNPLREHLNAAGDAKLSVVLRSNENGLLGQPRDAKAGTAQLDRRSSPCRRRGSREVAGEIVYFGLASRRVLTLVRFPCRAGQPNSTARREHASCKCGHGWTGRRGTLDLGERSDDKGRPAARARAEETSRPLGS